MPPSPGTVISPETIRFNHDDALLKEQVSNAAFEAGIPAWVRCMNRAGLPTVATPGGVTAGGWTYVLRKTPRAEFLDSAAGEDARDHIEADCMVQTYHLHG